MTTPTSDNLHIICPVAHAPIVNDTLRNIGEQSDGADPVAAPLCAVDTPSGPVIAVGSQWAMPAATNQAFKAAIRDAGWRPRPTTAELRIYDATSIGQVPLFGSGQRVWVFQAPHPWDPSVVIPNAVTYDEALAALGLVAYERPRS